MLHSENVRMTVVPELVDSLQKFNSGIVKPFEIPNQRNLIYPCGKIPVVASLDQFAVQINAQGIHKILMDHTRARRFMLENVPNGTRFIIGAFGWCQRICSEDSDHPFGCNLSRSKHNDANYFVDGDYGFSFGLECPDLDFPLWCGVSSFLFAGRISKFDMKLDFKDTIPDHAPIIVQFQGASFHCPYPVQRERSKDILCRVPWEYVLGTLIECWWRNISSNPLYFLPPSLSPYIRDKPNTVAKLETLRQQLGYKPDESSGIYKKIL